MKEEIFREKSLEKLKAPESTEDYIRTVSPSLWLVILAAGLLLAGAILWILLGYLPMTEAAEASAAETLLPLWR